MNGWAQAFTRQAEASRALGSPLTATVCEVLLRLVSSGEDHLSHRIRNWPGDPSHRGDSVPLRLCGALHALVLAGKAEALAKVYADPGSGGIDDAISSAIQDNTSCILDFIDLPPQTNEVARSAAIIAATWQVAALHPGVDFEALELGASAGLNLNFHRYHLVIESNDTQNPDGSVRLTPEWRGAPLLPHPLRITAATGVDINPLDPARDGLRLKAYVWPDQPQRLARMEAALRLAEAHPPRVDKADAADWLEARLAQPSPAGRFVYHTIAAQYFPPRTRARIEAALQLAGRTASDHAPLAHFSMESPATSGADLLLRVWSKGRQREWRLGRADAHARWIDWQPEEI